jgi:ribosomal protein S14
MELIVGGLIVLSLASFARMHTHIDSLAMKNMAQEQEARERAFVRETWTRDMSREAALRQSVREIARDQAQGGAETYERDKEIVRQMMRELAQEAKL